MKINKTVSESLFLHSHSEFSLQYNLFEQSIQNTVALEKQMDSQRGNRINYLRYYGLQTTQELHKCGKKIIHKSIGSPFYLHTTMKTYGPKLSLYPSFLFFILSSKYQSCFLR